MLICTFFLLINKNSHSLSTKNINVFTSIMIINKYIIDIFFNKLYLRLLINYITIIIIIIKYEWLTVNLYVIPDMLPIIMLYSIKQFDQ